MEHQADQVSRREGDICATWSLGLESQFLRPSKEGDAAQPRCDQNFPLSNSSSSSTTLQCYFVSCSCYTRAHCGICGCWSVYAGVLVLNVALQSSRGYDSVLQTDCTLSIGFEGREAYPRVHRDNKSKYCATPLRLNPRHCCCHWSSGKVRLVTRRRSPQSPHLKSVTGWGKEEIWGWWNPLCSVLKKGDRGRASGLI